ncbi:uncharacterized protein VTP21DRAFT_2646 [Calcarisporiella thermophila]|uniref:uncharacterized protein n=1 Tax=Calcarisporiella thermophila TaxID=911321 RepID=UPI0037432CEC
MSAIIRAFLGRNDYTMNKYKGGGSQWPEIMNIWERSKCWEKMIALDDCLHTRVNPRCIKSQENLEHSRRPVQRPPRSSNASPIEWRQLPKRVGENVWRVLVKYGIRMASSDGRAVSLEAGLSGQKAVGEAHWSEQLDLGLDQTYPQKRAM